jgi:hypothetical protein
VNTAQKDVSNNNIIFIYISLSVFSSTIISYFISQSFDTFYIYIIIWISSFSIFFLILRSKIMHSIYNIQSKIRKSTNWPTSLKVINGICWAAPFGLALLTPSFHEYLILTGIGLGNISTFIIFLLRNKIKNIDQLIVGSVSMISIGVIVFLYDWKVIDQSHGDFLARILISIAYGIGGIYSTIIKQE